MSAEHLEAAFIAVLQDTEDTTVEQVAQLLTDALRAYVEESADRVVEGIPLSAHEYAKTMDALFGACTCDDGSYYEPGYGLMHDCPVHDGLLS